jgi:hypothetical protein
MKQVPEVLFFPDGGRTPKESRRGARSCPHNRGCGLAPGRAHPLWGHPGRLLTPPLRLYKASGWKTLGESTKFPEQFRSFAAAADEFWGTEVSVLAPFRDG